MRADRITQSLMSCLVLFCTTQARAVAYSGGQGTCVSPYMLSCKEDILELASRPEDYDKSFVLTADIDLNGEVFEHSVISSTFAFSPIFGGEYKSMFTGCFNGNGHVIRNFSVKGDRAYGFFGGIGWAGRVMHLGLESVLVDGSNTAYVGMLAGVNMGVIVGCYAQGRVSGYSLVGGLVGYHYEGRIIDCFSRGRVEGVADGVGGLAGVMWAGEIQRCYAASGVTSAMPSGCGGLIGRSMSPVRGTPSIRVISDCFWDTEVSGVSASTGGLGLSTDRMYDLSTYLDATWDFSEEQNNGINDMWMCPAEGGYPVLSAFSGVMPVALAGDGSNEHPYIVSAARELAAMVYYGSRRSWEFPHFALEADIDLSAIQWSAPVLSTFYGYFDGRGYCMRGLRQEGSCGLIGVIERDATVANLRLEETEVNAKEGAVGSLAGENRGLIQSCSVTGTLTGGTVTGGLVGSNTGSIWDCSFSGVTAGSQKTGGLVGENTRVITNSVSRGTVSGDSSVGGLAGTNTSAGSIRSCFSTAAVAGQSQVGGLVGTNAGSVTDCHARGGVAGDHCVGGLVGQNDRQVSRCYSTGSVAGLKGLGGLVGCVDASTGSALNSFWDVDAAGIQISSGGSGLDRKKMQDRNTFVSSGWDFVGETANGTQDLWVMPDSSYPELTMSLKIPPPPATRI